MKANTYYDKDANLDLLSDTTVAVIGYGSQGHAHALNMKESGIDVVVGLRKGSKSWALAEEEGLKVVETAEAAQLGSIIMVLVPDQNQPEVYKKSIEPHLKENDALVFALVVCVNEFRGVRR